MLVRIAFSTEQQPGILRRVIEPLFHETSFPYEILSQTCWTENAKTNSSQGPTVPGEMKWPNTRSDHDTHQPSKCRIKAPMVCVN